MGGVRTDGDGRTSLPRLFAAGEAACTGVHGANRLASNSLLEGLVFGARSGRRMRETAASLRHTSIDEPEALFPQVTERELRELSWKAMGIARSGPVLARAIGLLQSIEMAPNSQARLPQYDLRSIHIVATLIARSALLREESRGAHFRTDFPEKSAAFERPSILSGLTSHAGRR
jgi:L-aspartate oxidase